jgi:hypothetical protein
VKRYWLILIGLGVVMAVPGQAQMPNQFEAAPGPVAPAHPPPSHAVMPPPVPAPAPPPPPSVEPAVGWDGVWQGDYRCAPTGYSVVVLNVAVEIKNGRVASMTGAHKAADTWSGEIGPGGAASIIWTGVSEGPPHYDRPRGEAFSIRIDGRFTGGTFVGASAARAGGCELHLERFG